MNRREFVRTLAGIPLLGLLVRVPKTKEELHLIMPGDPDYIDVGIGGGKGINLVFPDDSGYIEVWTREIVDVNALESMMR